jgi:cytochrome oxidase Cu insertion factor (SCO1/SenC/PrrC family)
MRRRLRTRASLGGGVLAAVVALAATAAVGAPDFASLQIQPYEPPKPAPAFTLPDLEGRPVRLEDFRGKVLMLFFWTTW